MVQATSLKRSVILLFYFVTVKHLKINMRFQNAAFTALLLQFKLINFADKSLNTFVVFFYDISLITYCNQIFFSF